MKHLWGHSCNHFRNDPMQMCEITNIYSINNVFYAKRNTKEVQRDQIQTPFGGQEIGAPLPIQLFGNLLLVFAHFSNVMRRLTVASDWHQWSVDCRFGYV
ncbi:hypothetical protein J6590_061787 [Homalodisca vitripennis]|nr:hypothetical protein J6590_061787 [Homalodisca vitripennis]